MMQVRLLVALLLSSLQADAVELYKWKDAAGQIQYSDLAPPGDARSVERITPKNNVIESDLPPFETKVASQKYPVTIYSFKECGDPCAKAEAFLAKRGVPFTLKGKDEDKVALKKLTGDTVAPVLVVGPQAPAVGFQEARWNELLDLAGYPPSNPLANIKKVPETPAKRPIKDDAKGAR